ncbi:MAG TPA: glycosyltransferase family 4 protein [Vicinamibacterales bacterium]|nr:glycosyltransferase family 4 protein [Vicinamibacterales bacterium]
MSDRRLRLCLISQEFPPHTNWGGIAVYNGELAAAYAARGHDVTVISRASPGAPARAQHWGGTVLRVGVPITRKRLTGRTIDRILHARAVSNVVTELDRERPFDVFETTEAGLEGEQLVRREAFRRRLVIQCNGSNAFGEAPGGVLASLHRADWAWSFTREQFVLRCVPVIIVTSEATRGVLTRQGLSPAKMTLIPQGIDVARFSPAARAERTGRLRVGFVGRLEKRKGIDFIWRIIERLAPSGLFEFHLKGALHPATRQDTERRLRAFRTDVTHHLPGGHDDMPAFYRSLDVLLQPSRFENFGLAYAEAMACGVLVLAGERGGGREIVTDGVTGFLVDPDGPIERAIAILERAASEPHAFAPLIVSGRDDIVRRFSLDRCAERKLELYASLASRTAA